jgi:hypothetical protein
MSRALLFRLKSTSRVEPIIIHPTTLQGMAREREGEGKASTEPRLLQVVALLQLAHQLHHLSQIASSRTNDINFVGLSLIVINLIPAVLRLFLVTKYYNKFDCYCTVPRGIVVMIMRTAFSTAVYRVSLVPRPSLDLPAFNVTRKKLLRATLKAGRSREFFACNIKSWEIERGPGDEATWIPYAGFPVSHHVFVS